MRTYNIEGMSCGKCVAKIESAFQDIAGARVSLTPPQLSLPDDHALSDADVASRLETAGDYKIADAPAATPTRAAPPVFSATWFRTYRPLLLIVGYISVASLAGAATLHDWMIHFMAGFFLVFSFFKFLDLDGFADAYAGYDFLAARARWYGYVYPFIELSIGLLFLFKIALFPVLIFTIVLMSCSSIGVIRAVMNKQKIRCACLGTVLNLPMSTVTIIEDVGMVLMSVAMLSAV